MDLNTIEPYVGVNLTTTDLIHIGIDGVNGRSAYQIDVDNGYQGSEQQWLESLRMPGTIALEYAREALEKSEATSALVEKSETIIEAAGDIVEKTTEISTRAQEAARSAEDKAVQAAAAALAAAEAATYAQTQGQRTEQLADILTATCSKSGANMTAGYYSASHTPLKLKNNKTIEVFFKIKKLPGSLSILLAHHSSWDNLEICINPNALDIGISFAQKVLYCPTLEVGRPYHFVISLASDSFSVMHNGVVMRSGTFNPSSLVNATAFSVGGRSDKPISIANDVDIYHARIFNYAMDKEQMLGLWNEGKPGEKALRRAEKGLTGNCCIGEYLPSGLGTDRWYDSSGNGHDLAIFGDPEQIYDPADDMSEFQIDSGVFFADIAWGVASKNITIPRGYVPKEVIVCNYNGTDILVNASLSSSTLFNGVQLKAGYKLTHAVSGTQSYVNSGTGKGSEILCLNAVGNGVPGGMKVMVNCKYTGE